LHLQFTIRLRTFASVLLALVLASSGCGKKQESAHVGASRTLAINPPAEGIEDSAPSALAANAAAATPRREIIYTGETTLEVDDVEKTTGQVEKTLANVKGWVSGHQLNVDTEGRRVATIAMRIPAAQFSDVHDSLRRLGEVIHDEVRSQDVGMEFVDLEARARNLQREESVISGLFSRGGKIGDVLQVERELARVRGEIEQTQGRLRYLTDQVAFSTLSLTLTPKRPAIERKVASWNMGYHVLRAWHLLVGVAKGFTYFVVYTAIVIGPFALLGWGIWRVVRTRRRSMPKQETPPAGEGR
jgi:hypothetical protein